jgi:hypothetical protein
MWMSVVAVACSTEGRILRGLLSVVTSFESDAVDNVLLRLAALRFLAFFYLYILHIHDIFFFE